MLELFGRVGVDAARAEVLVCVSERTFERER
jgi:hypothetical protein